MNIPTNRITVMERALIVTLTGLYLVLPNMYIKMLICPEITLNLISLQARYHHPGSLGELGVPPPMVWKNLTLMHTLRPFSSK